MAYENTEVGIPKSQDQIRNLIYAHAGTGLMLISRPPHEGFEAMVTLNKLSYHIRVMAIATVIKSYDTAGRNRSKKIIEDLTAKENRRVWRVLYWHLKAMFEAADSGVIDIRDVIMPYVVLRDGRTLSDHVKPNLPGLIEGDPSRLLPQVVQP